jgi:hypothetical protein
VELATGPAVLGAIVLGAIMVGSVVPGVVVSEGVGLEGVGLGAVLEGVGLGAVLEGVGLGAALEGVGLGAVDLTDSFLLAGEVGLEDAVLEDAGLLVGLGWLAGCNVEGAGGAILAAPAEAGWAAGFGVAGVRPPVHNLDMTV